MNCPRCNGKCKVVQTHKGTKVITEPDTKVGSNFEVEMTNKIMQVPIIKRKQHCPNCDCYFWTEENFKCYTEATTKKTMMESLLDKFNEVSKDFDKTEGLVYSNKPIDKLPPIKLDIHIGRK